MKKQWRKFLDENDANWSYGIVPSLVERLDKALKAGDDGIVQDMVAYLASQGVILDENGNLCFATDIALGN